MRRSTSAALTKVAMRRMTRSGRLSRWTMGACHSVCPSASKAIRSRVRSLMSAAWLARTAAMASTTPLATTASTTGSARPRRRDSASREPPSAPPAMISRRSWSLSNGEYSSTGAATISSTSSASRRTTWLGTLAASLISSAMMARTLGTSSRARISSTSRTMVVQALVLVRGQVRRQAPDLVGELGAHAFVHIGGEHMVGLQGRAPVLRHLAAHLGRIVGGQVVEELGLQVVVGGEAAARLDVALGGDALGRRVVGPLAGPPAALVVGLVAEHPVQHGVPVRRRRTASSEPRIAQNRRSKNRHAPGHGRTPTRFLAECGEPALSVPVAARSVASW